MHRCHSKEDFRELHVEWKSTVTWKLKPLKSITILRLCLREWRDLPCCCWSTPGAQAVIRNKTASERVLLGGNIRAQTPRDVFDKTAMDANPPCKHHGHGYYRRKCLYMVGVYQICQKEDSCEVDLVHVGRLRVVFQLSGDGLRFIWPQEWFSFRRKPRGCGCRCKLCGRYEEYCWKQEENKIQRNEAIVFTFISSPVISCRKELWYIWVWQTAWKYRSWHHQLPSSSLIPIQWRNALYQSWHSCTWLGWTRLDPWCEVVASSYLPCSNNTCPTPWSVILDCECSGPRAFTKMHAPFAIGYSFLAFVFAPVSGCSSPWAFWSIASAIFNGFGASSYLPWLNTTNGVQWFGVENGLFVQTHVFQSPIGIFGEFRGFVNNLIS